jgi:hypothetical protein
MDEPSFLRRAVNDQELTAELDDLRAGRYPRWQLIADSPWQSTQIEGGTFVLGRFWTIWLREDKGERIAVTLRHARACDEWRRGEPDEPGW